MLANATPPVFKTPQNTLSTISYESDGPQVSLPPDSSESDDDFSLLNLDTHNKKRSDIDINKGNRETEIKTQFKGFKSDSVSSIQSQSKSASSKTVEKVYHY